MASAARAPDGAPNSRATASSASPSKPRSGKAVAFHRHRRTARGGASSSRLDPGSHRDEKISSVRSQPSSLARSYSAVGIDVVPRRDVPIVDHVVRLQLPRVAAPAALKHEADEQHVDRTQLSNVEPLPTSARVTLSRRSP